MSRALSLGRQLGSRPGAIPSDRGVSTRAGGGGKVGRGKTSRGGEGGAGPPRRGGAGRTPGTTGKAKVPPGGGAFCPPPPRWGGGGGGGGEALTGTGDRFRT